MKKLIKIMSVFTLIIGISGCNTISGIGEDLSAGGKAMSKSAQDVKSGFEKDTGEKYDN